MKLGLLIWKNFLIRIRHPVRTIFEIIWPLLIFVILISIRLSIDLKTTPECHFPARALPSAGVFPWLQSMFCNLDRNTTCLQHEVPSEVPGQIRPENSMLDDLLTLWINSEEDDSTLLQNFNSEVESLRRIRRLTGSRISTNETEANSCEETCDLECLLNEECSFEQMQQLFNEFAQLVCPFHNHNLSELPTEPEIRAILKSIRPLFSKPSSPLLAPKNSTEEWTCEKFLYNISHEEIWLKFWDTFRGLIAGEIIYYPKTSLTQEIMKNANQTFEALEDFAQFTRSAEFHRFAKKLESVLGAANLADLGENLGRIVGCFKLDKIRGFEDKEALESELDELMCSTPDLVNDKNCTPSLWGYVEFQTQDGTPVYPDLLDLDIIKYTIRITRDTVTSTLSTAPLWWTPGSKNGGSRMKYFSGGFIYIQNMIDNGIILTKSNLDKVPMGAYLQMFSYQCYTSDSFLDVISGMMPILLSLSWVFTVAITVKNIVWEKESRQKELMKMIGLSGGTLWGSWWLDTMSMMILSCTGLTIIIKYGDIFHHSDGFITFLFLFGYAFASASIAFLISTFFSSANLSAACGGIIYFFLYLPYNMCAIWEFKIPRWLKFIASLIPTVPLGYGSWQFSDLEKEGTGAQWGNLNTEFGINQRYMNIAECMLMLYFDGVFYYFLAWYIDNFFPGEFGVPRKWYFFIQPSFWTGKSKRNTSEEIYKGQKESDKKVKQEAVSKELNTGVELQGLTKIYKASGCRSGEDKLAVDDLSLKLYSNQITSFLGHNGAGKTTTMSMLTGIYTPSGGTALIDGYDIWTQMDQVRTVLGFCPQHNVLFEDLTCAEHIEFFCSLKGQSKKKTKIEIDELLEKCGLMSKKHLKVPTLSGGMKRKLSVALAFCGGSKIVLLDEPTAGVDPYARRGIWDLLTGFKTGRTILLSTHHMDEADVLGDRIAIIAAGRLKCAGSSLWLKSNYGEGYYLTVNTRFHDETRDAINSCGNEHLDVVETKLNSISFRVPYHFVEQDLIAKILDKLESNELNGIDSYGIRDSSLEEIFIKIASQDEKEKRKNSEEEEPEGRKSLSLSSTIEGTGTGNKIHPELIDKGRNVQGTLVGGALRRQQFEAIFEKRAITVSRSIKSFFASIVVPPLFIALALAMTLLVPDVSESTPLEMEAMMFENKSEARAYGVNTFTSLDIDTDPVYSKLYNSLLSKPGFGTWCLNTTSSAEKRKWTIDYAKEKGFDLSDRYCSDANVDPEEYLLPNASWSLSRPVGSETNDACACTYGDYINPLMDCGRYPNDHPSYPGQKKFAGGENTPIFELYGGMHNYNMNGRNITDWVQKTVDKDTFVFQRYGGFSIGANALNESLLNLQPGLEDRLDPFIRHRNSKIWFNNVGYHASVAYYNIFANSLLRSSLPDRNPEELGIDVVNYPLDFDLNNIDAAAFQQASTDVIIAICVVFALSFIPASFVVFLIEERASGAKHLQFLSGMNPNIYWIANYCWDILIFLFPTALSIAIFALFQSNAYTGKDNIGSLVLLFILFGLAATPLMYPATYLFDKPATAYVALTAFNLFIGINTTIAVSVMMSIAESDPDLEYIYIILDNVFLLFPHFCLGRGLMEMAIQQAYLDAYAELGFEQERKKPILAFEYNGRCCLAMAIQTIVFFSLVLFIQHRSTAKSSSKIVTSSSGKLEESDVAAETARAHDENNKDLLRIKMLTKLFQQKGGSGTFTAVDGISLSVPKGECFGLLGVNGAGKTTTFKMLTTDLAPSSGDAFINDLSLVQSPDKTRRYIGYCPQFDGLNSVLTSAEHIRYYAKIRGIKKNELKDMVEWALHELNLTEYRNIPAGEYSGGNKRKLSTAIAFTGAPEVILLDEPTAGVDPKARRFLWDVIKRMVQKGHAIVLTSHSMEECEILCGRLAIMVNGSFECLGSSQHLKAKYGEGYIVAVQGKRSKHDSIINGLSDQFADVKVTEQRSNNLQLQLVEMNSLKTLFSSLQTMKKQDLLTDYRISQTTLDDVFISFAKRQGNEKTEAEINEEGDFQIVEMPIPKISVSEAEKFGSQESNF